MKEIKRRLIKDVANKIEKLPTDKQQYVLGIMDGILISCDSTQRSEPKEEGKDERITENWKP